MLVSKFNITFTLTITTLMADLDPYNIKYYIILMNIGIVIISHLDM